jgi:hypothetical protein
MKEPRPPLRRRVKASPSSSALPVDGLHRSRASASWRSSPSIRTAVGVALRRPRRPRFAAASRVGSSRRAAQSDLAHFDANARQPPTAGHAVGPSQTLPPASRSTNSLNSPPISRRPFGQPWPRSKDQRFGGWNDSRKRRKRSDEGKRSLQVRDQLGIYRQQFTSFPLGQSHVETVVEVVACRDRVPGTSYRTRGPCAQNSRGKAGDFQ